MDAQFVLYRGRELRAFHFRNDVWRVLDHDSEGDVIRFIHRDRLTFL